MKRAFHALPVAIIGLALAGFLSSCGGKTGGGGDESKIEGGGEIVATFAGDELSLEEFQAEVDKLPPQVKPMLSAPDRRKQFLETFILSRLLIEEAKRKGLHEDEEIQSQLEEMEKRLILQRVFEDLQRSVTITDEEARAYYEAHLEEFSTTEIRASHILVEGEAAAEEVLQKVKADPDSFDTLAKKLSKDTATASKGGDLGFFGRGRMVPEFEKAAFELKSPGDISDVVKSPFGYHVIKLKEKKVGKSKPLDQVKEQIRSKLLQEGQQKKMEEHFEQLKREAKVKIDEQVLAKYNPGPGGQSPAPQGSGALPVAPSEEAPSDLENEASGAGKE